MDSMMVGYDGLAPSRVALDWVAARAAQRPSRVELVTVVAGDVFAEDGPSVAVDGAERRLRNVAPNVEVTSQQVAGKMPDALLRAANRADLLVIGAHRRRPLQSALTGRRPLRVVSRSRVPVVVVPEEWEPADGPVLVGVDDDDSSAAAVEYAAAEAGRLGVGLTVLHAWLMPQPTMDGAVAYLASPIEERAVHRRILDQVHAHVASTHPDLAVEKILVQNNPSSALLIEAKRSSMLVIGTHHRGVFAGALLGSVGQDILMESRIPVCVVPTQAPG